MGKSYTFSTPLDGEVLESFYGGDLEYALDMFEVCLAEMPNDLSNLRLAFADKNALDCRKILHKIKPTFTMVGNDPLSQECTRVEKLIHAQNVSFEFVQEDVSSIIEEIDQTLSLLAQESTNLRQFLQQ